MQIKGNHFRQFEDSLAETGKNFLDYVNPIEIHKTLIALEISLFFSKNLYFMDTADKLSSYLQRGRKELSLVSLILEALIKKGILEKTGDGFSAIYSVTYDNPKTIEYFEQLEKI